jgi:uncharacterized membrane protein
MNAKKRTISSILFLFVLSVVIMLKQLISESFFSAFTADTYVQTSWAWQFAEALHEGIIYPRWTPLDFWHYGSPAFLPYSPFAFYLVALFKFFTGSIITAMNMTKCAALFLSATGMFFLVREFYSRNIALLTASFYILFPYTVFQFYFVGSFTSTISFIWFSPIVLFVCRYIKRNEYKELLLAGMCYGGLILTHLINAYIFTLVITIFIISLSLAKKKAQYLLALPVVVITGILVSSAYVFPLIYEKGFIDTKTFIGIGEGWPYYYFLLLPDLTHKLPADHFWPVYYNTFVFYIFFFSTLLVLVFLFTRKLRRANEDDIVHINTVMLLIAVGSLFFLFGISRFLWEIIPFFKYIQFPTRLLNVTTVAVVFLSAAIFHVLYPMENKKSRRYVFIVLLFVLFIFLDYKYISSPPFFTKHELLPAKSTHWILYTLPKGVDLERIRTDKEIGEKASVVGGYGKADVKAWDSAKRVIEITGSGPRTVRIRTFNFPGWKAYIDGAETKIKTENGTGAMLVDIADGTQKLVLKFEDTPVRFYSKIVSLISFFVIIAIVSTPRRTGRR